MFPAPLHRGQTASLINPDQQLFRSIMYDERVFRNIESALVSTGLSSSQLVWLFLFSMAAWTFGVTLPELDAQHFRELAMAFVAGGACLTLVFGVIRGWPFARQGPAGLETGSSRIVTGFLPRNDNAEIANGDYFLVASEHETELPWASRDLELELSS
eukprot:symbB.v1.2.034930.t3/scaffold4597.1/size37581/6